MVQPDLLQLARQGDLRAIALLLNHKLQPRGVTVRVKREEGCLKILLVADRPLEQQAFVRFLQQQIGSFGIASLKQVKVYSQRPGETLPNWSQDFVPLITAKTSQPPLKPLDLPQLPPPPDPTSPPPAPGMETGAIVKYKAAPPSGFWAALRSLPLNALFPYEDVFSIDLYRSQTVRLLLFLGLFPLVINLFAEQASLAQTAWLLGIYYACIWGVVLHDIIRPVHFSWGNTLKCTLFTTFIGIPTLLFFQRVPPFNTLYDAVNGGLVARLIGFVLGVGLLEELCKALPVYLLLLRPKRLRDPQTAAFYGAMSGLGFAIAEGATYSLRYAFGLSRGEIGLGSYVAANTIRFVSLPLFHAILAGIVGYFMGLAAVNPSRQTPLLCIGLVIAAVLHGAYNTFAGGILGPFIIGFSIVLFVSYLRRSKAMVEVLEAAEEEDRE